MCFLNDISIMVSHLQIGIAGNCIGDTYKNWHMYQQYFLDTVSQNTFSNIFVKLIKSSHPLQSILFFILHTSKILVLVLLKIFRSIVNNPDKTSGSVAMPWNYVKRRLAICTTLQTSWPFNTPHNM